MSAKKYDVKLEHIPANELLIDERVQRAVEPAHVRKLVREWDELGVGVLIGSRRRDGKVRLCDGMQRREAMLQMEPDREMVVVVYEGLSLKEEARLFLALNKSRKNVGAYFIHRVDLTLGDPVALAIERVLSELGLATAQSSSTGKVGCVAAMTRIVGRGNDVERGAEALRFALSVYADAWPNPSQLWRSEVVEGLASMHHLYGDEVDAASLSRKLATHRVYSDPIDVLSAAKRRAVGSNRVVTQIVDVLVELYDNGRRTRRLRPEAA